MREFKHSNSGSNGNFIVFTKMAGMVKPTNGTFNYPSPREFLPMVRFNFFENINVK